MNSPLSLIRTETARRLLGVVEKEERCDYCKSVCEFNRGLDAARSALIAECKAMGIDPPSQTGDDTS